MKRSQQPHRAPAVPLVVNAPYFSLWSMSDKLTDSQTKHWTEVPQSMVGLARIDGTNYRWMGTAAHRHIEPMEQRSVQITPLHTRYV